MAASATALPISLLDKEDLLAQIVEEVCTEDGCVCIVNDDCDSKCCSALPDAKADLANELVCSVECYKVPLDFSVLGTIAYWLGYFVFLIGWVTIGVITLTKKKLPLETSSANDNPEEQLASASASESHGEDNSLLILTEPDKMHLKPLL